MAYFTDDDKKKLGPRGITPGDIDCLTARSKAREAREGIYKQLEHLGEELKKAREAKYQNPEFIASLEQKIDALKVMVRIQESR